MRVTNFRGHPIYGNLHPLYGMLFPFSCLQRVYSCIVSIYILIKPFCRGYGVQPVNLATKAV